MPISEIISSLSSNPYFGAGFGLVGVGAGIAYLRKGYEIGKVLFKRHYLVSMELVCRDKSYNWLLNWITKNTRHTQHMSVETDFRQLDSGKIETSFNFIPSVGIHFFNYKGKWIKVERTREQQTLDLSMGIPFETVKLTCFGQDKTIYYDILKEARDEALLMNEGKTVMYTAMGHEWRELGDPRKRRPLNSVILDENKSERILKDIQEFINTPKWYSDRGIPYRRGYLLYGPAGTGKTSFITALAGELEYSICVLNLSERGLSDDRLNYLMMKVPSQSIVLLEDIDSAFVNRNESSAVKSAYDGLNQVTFSGLLNMLDGVASTEARILFMTTNYIERLDPALIRPGRIDVKEYIGYASRYQMIRAFQKFYPEVNNKVAQQFADKVESFKQNISMAQLQGYFLFHKESYENAIKDIEMLIKK